MKRARYSILIFLVFGGIAIAYYLLSHDAGGATMLFVLGIAMWLTAYVLIAGSASDA